MVGVDVAISSVRRCVRRAFFAGRSNLREGLKVSRGATNLRGNGGRRKRWLFFSLSLSLSRRCLLEPNNAGVHTLLARYKLEVRAHMANTYLCRRRNSRRSKNAKFQQTHWPDKKVERVEQKLLFSTLRGILRFKGNVLISRRGEIRRRSGRILTY